MARQRVGLDFFRRAGLIAPASSFRQLVLNASSEGIYLRVESVDRQFLERYFPEDDGGNLFSLADNVYYITLMSIVII